MLFCLFNHGGVKPNEANVPVAGQKLGNLRLDFVFKTNVVILFVIFGEIPAVASKSRNAYVVFVLKGICIAAAVEFVPVKALRVVKPKLKVVFLACFGKLTYNVTLEGGAVNAVETVNIGLEKAEALVVL